MVRSFLSLGLLSLATPLFSQFVYVANLGGGISAYSIDAGTGALTPIPGSPFATGKQPHSIGVDPGGRFAYVPNRFDNTISAYAINPNSGVLTQIPGSPFAIGANPLAIEVEPSGRFAYVTAGSEDSNPGSIWGYKINSTTGALTPFAGSPVVAGAYPQWLAVDPNGKYLYVPNTHSNNVSGFAINTTTGLLTPVPGSPFGAGSGPNTAAIVPNGKFLYVANYDSTISGYAINVATGALTPVSGSPFGAEGGPSGDTIDPTGRFFYSADAINVSSGAVSGYTINATTGTLTPIPGSPFAAHGYSQSVAVDTTGRFAYVANQKTDNLSGYTINAASGALSPIPGAPYPAGSFPSYLVAITPASTPDITPPFVALFGTTAGPPKQVQISSLDRQSGLSSIDVLSCTNCTATTPAFSPGTKSAVLTTATKINQSQSSAVKIQASDVAGHSTVYDPVDITIVEDGRVDLHEVTISSEEHVVEITNGKPGIHTLILKLHNSEIPVLFLKNGETRTIDIGYALRRGSQNVVRIFSYGRRRATTSIVFTEP